MTYTRDPALQAHQAPLRPYDWAVMALPLS